jgi:rhodanese-related sulfurtransferase
VADRGFGDCPIAVISGDALFSGDFGRTDFFPDHVILLPAHGAGSVCGSGQRAIIAASTLKQHGFDQVEDSLGSMAACSAIGCPIDN